MKKQNRFNKNYQYWFLFIVTISIFCFTIRSKNMRYYLFWMSRCCVVHRFSYDHEIKSITLNYILNLFERIEIIFPFSNRTFQRITILQCTITASKYIFNTYIIIDNNPPNYHISLFVAICRYSIKVGFHILFLI